MAPLEPKEEGNDDVLIKGEKEEEKSETEATEGEDQSSTSSSSEGETDTEAPPSEPLLPPELLRHIAQILIDTNKRGTLARFAGVSRAFHEIGIEYLYRHLPLHSLPKHFADYFLRNDFAKHVRKITVRGSRSTIVPMVTACAPFLNEMDIDRQGRYTSDLLHLAAERVSETFHTLTLRNPYLNRYRGGLERPRHVEREWPDSYPFVRVLRLIADDERQTPGDPRGLLRYFDRTLPNLLEVHLRYAPVISPAFLRETPRLTGKIKVVGNLPSGNWLWAAELPQLRPTQLATFSAGFEQLWENLALLPELKQVTIIAEQTSRLLPGLAVLSRIPSLRLVNPHFDIPDDKLDLLRHGLAQLRKIEISVVDCHSPWRDQEGVEWKVWKEHVGTTFRDSFGDGSDEEREHEGQDLDGEDEDEDEDEEDGEGEGRAGGEGGGLRILTQV